MRVFTLVVLPAQSAHVPVLAKNMNLDCLEDCPCPDSTRVLPAPKGQGMQMHIVAHPHPRGTSGSSNSAATNSASLTRSSAYSSISSTAGSTSISLFAFLAAATAAVSPTDQLCQIHEKEWSYIAPPFHLEENGLQQEGHLCPRRPYDL